MEKRFILTTKGKGTYGASYSQISSSNLLYVDKPNISLSDVVKVGREADTIILRNSVLFNTGLGFNAYVSDILLLSNDRMLVFGGFTTYNDQLVNNGMVMLDKSGNINQTFNYGTGLGGFIAYTGTQRALYDSTTDSIYIIGSFTSYNGTPASGIVKVNMNGTIDTSFNYGTGFGGSVLCYGVYPDTLSSSIYVNGIFSSYKGITERRLVKILPNGNKDTSFITGTGFNNAVTSLKINSDGTLFAVGYFSNYNGTAVTRIAKVGPTGSLVSEFNSGTGFNNSLIVLNNDNSNDLYAVGNFTAYRGVTASGIVKIDIETGLIDNTFLYGTGFSGGVPVSIFRNDDSSLYVVGEFTTYNGVTASGVIKLSPDGSVDTTFKTGSGFNFPAYRVVVKDGRVIMGGSFTTYNGFPAENIVKLNHDGSIYTGSELSFIDGRATYNIKNLIDTTDEELLPKSLIKELIQNTNIVTLEYSEVDTLINNNELELGTIYGIVNNYNGYIAYLQAMTSNKLSDSGVGLFYTPKYDQNTPGYGIWTRDMEILFDTNSSDFLMGETVSGDNGTVGIFRGQNLIEWESGTWSGTSIITGLVTGETVTISGASSPTYSLGSTTIWGGKHWLNVGNSVGDSIDKYTLNSVWREIPFNSDDYNVSLDEIKYDYTYGTIVYRKDRYGNEVSYPYNLQIQPSTGNIMFDFQWGNGYDGEEITYYIKKGVNNNKVINSYFDCLNWRNQYIINNRFENTNIYNVRVNSELGIESNEFYNSSIYDTNLTGLSFTNSKFNSFIAHSSDLNGLDIDYCVFDNFGLTNIKTYYLYIGESHIKSSFINGGKLISSSFVSDNFLNVTFETPNLNGIDFNYNDITNTTFYNLGIISNEISNNKIHNSFINWTGIPTTNTIKYLNIDNMYGDTGTPINMTTATIIYGASYSKYIFVRQDGTNRISYYDNTDTLIIGNINS